MAQQIKQANIFGRLGSGVGKGLAEQVPKEIENYRLRSGLQNLADLSDQGGLSPAQFLAKASGTYGVTPQHVQSFAELAKQQARGQALIESSNKQRQPQESPFPQREPQVNPQGGQSPSITKEKPLAKIQEGYIPPTREEKDLLAGDVYNQNPARWNNDPQKAIEWVEDKVHQEEKINEAYERQHGKLSDIQDNVIKRLKDHVSNLGAQIPAEVYSKIEDKAIQATKPRSEGGEGLTEQEAMKKYGKEADEISRQYNDVEAIGDWTLPLRKPKETLAAINSLRKQFKERGDVRNFAHTLEAKIGTSPSFSYALADPVKEYPKLNLALKNLPVLKGKTVSAGRGLVGTQGITNKESREKTLKAAEELFPLLKSGASPQSVGWELQKKGYDPAVWKEYLTERKDELTGLQIDQLPKLDSATGRFNDYWLSSWSGIE